jgi:isopenicillin N synthase-like dioxygenase
MPESLPVIDVSALRGDAASDRLADIAAEIRAASERHGFFYIVGHGLPETQLDDILAHARSLFALPEGAKASMAMDNHHGGRGYARMGGRTSEGALQAAYKEEFYLGPEGPGQENNVWPVELPTFPATMQRYLSDLLTLSSRLMAGFARSLDLPPDYFEPFCTKPIAALRLVRYSPQSEGAGPHADFGSLTILLQDAVGGLQVQDRETGAWIDAPPLRGSFVVNVGDLFERWTNDRYRSSVHRVVPAGRDRYSAPFFLTGSPKQVIECLPTCLPPGHAALYPPVTVEDHLRAGFAAQGF